MTKLLFSSLLLLLSFSLTAQLRLNVNGDGKIDGDLSIGSSVLFGNSISGPGSKLLWVPGKGAFRVGTLAEIGNTPELEGDYWNIDSIGDYSFASGLNTRALAANSFVGGGEANTASATLSAVVGGRLNLASAYASSVFGGVEHTVSGIYSAVLGGSRNTAAGTWATVAGGNSNQSSGQSAFIGGGANNIASGADAATLGGFFNTSSGFASVVAGGEQNSATNLYAHIGGGYGNTASGQYTFIGGGYNLLARSYAEAVFGYWNEDYTPSSLGGPVLTDRLFVIGNGTSDVRRNALTVLKNGNVGIGAVVPKAPLQINTTSSVNPDENGLYVLNKNNSADQHAIIGTRVSGSSAGDAFISFDILGEAGWSVGVDNDDANKLKFSSGWRSLSAQTKMTIQINGFVGIGTTTPAGALDVAGSIYQNSALIHSDSRLKQNIRPIRSAIDKIRQLEGVTYNFRSDFQKTRGFDNRQHLGVIAQQVEEVFPELVREGDGGYKAINYDGLIPVLIEGIKEQQEHIEEIAQKSDRIRQLEEQVAELKTMVEQLLAHQASGAQIHQEIMELNAAARLGQNLPNPFHQNTVIPYFIPEGVKTAEIRITTGNGTVISRKQLAEKGNGQLNIKANSLPAGTYYYSLVLDGKIWDTQKMVLTK